MQSLTQWISSLLADPLVSKLFVAVAGILAISLLIRSFQYSLTRYLKDSDTRYYGRKLISLLGYLAGFVFITIVFKDRLGGLTVAIGVASAGIAFALQEVIASVAGWIAISAGGFYNPGDRVQLGGSKGDVIDIGILRTTLMELGEWVESDLYTGRIVRIANSFVFKAPVFNYSGDFPYLWDEIKIPVKYGSDHRLARSILEEVIADMIPANTTANVKAAWKVMFKKYLIEDARINPVVSLVLTDNWIGFTVRYVVDYKTRRLIKDQLFTRILDEFAMTEHRVNIASTTIQLTEAPTLNVKLENNQR